MARWKLTVREYWDRVSLVAGETADEARLVCDRDPAAAFELDFDFIGIEPDGELIEPFLGEPDPQGSPAGFRGGPTTPIPESDGRPRWTVTSRELWDRVFLVEADDEDEAFEAYIRNQESLLETGFSFVGLEQDGEDVEPYKES